MFSMFINISLAIGAKAAIGEENIHYASSAMRLRLALRVSRKRRM